MTALAAAVGALLGAALGGAPGFFIGGLAGYIVGRERTLREQQRKLEETEARLSRLQIWATEMKAWSEQAYARMTERSDPPGTVAPDAAAPETASPDTVGPESATPDTQPGVPVQAESVPTPVASDPGTVVRAPVPGASALPPPDPTTRAPLPVGTVPADALPTSPAPTSPLPADTAPAGPAPGDTPPAGPVAGESWSGDGRADAAGRDASAEPPVGLLRRLVGAVKDWITTGNAPVKVGVLISLIGVGLLLREAGRRGVITVTIEMRLIAVALFGLALLAVGWRLRRKNPVYGLSLQGGAVAVLYLTTYASFAVYDLLPPAPAAAAVILVTLGTGFLSVTQDSRVLAVLGIIGGFLAPVLTYSRPEDHAMVFGFYTVLSAAIVAVAWYKTWPELNLAGLGFTFGIAAFWLSRRFDQDDWAEVQPLIAALILLYLVIPVLFAVREAPDLRRPSTAPLVFGTPFLGFGLQYLAVGHTSHGMALSAAALALAHGVLAAVAHRLGRECRSLAEANVGLGAAFAVIAVPLAFDAHLTAVVWAALGGLLVWIGCRRARRLAVAAGGVLQVLAGIAFEGHLERTLPYPEDAMPVANGVFLGAAVLAAVGLMTGLLLHRPRGRVGVAPAVVWLALVWGAGWWVAGGLMEISHHLPSQRLAASLCFVVLSLGAASAVSDRLRWPHLDTLGVAIGPTLWLAALVSLVTQGLHPLDRFGWAAWPVALAVLYLFLRFREDRFERLSDALHGGAYWLLALLVGAEAYWQTDQAASGVWLIVAPAAAGTALAAAALLGGRWLRWPLRVHRRCYVSACAGPTLLFVGAVVGVACLSSPGDPSPLPYAPLLNPLMALTAALVWVGFVWAAAARRLRDEAITGAGAPSDYRADPDYPTHQHYRADPADPDYQTRQHDRASWALPAGIAAVALASVEVARTVHHWRDVPWDFETMFDSTVFQVALSILWMLVGLAAMVAGTRSDRRVVWVLGGAWTVAVLVKLLAVDLSVVSAPGRAVSFIVAGTVLLVIGYLAPVAPAPASPSTDEPKDPHEDPVGWLAVRVMRWLTDGNAPVKVGVVVSVIGAGLLLTEAAGQGLLASPISVRLSAVAAAAVLLLAIGWAQRQVRPSFGLSLQGGGIALAHVAVYAGYPVHGVVPAALAGAAVVAVTACAVALAVSQDSRALAVLGTTGGFLAPVVTYTSPDDHALLFGFYVILSAAVVVVAWFKAWPELTLLGLISTFGISAWWLWERLDQDDWMGVQPLIAVLALLYMAVPVLSARRGAPAVGELWMHPVVFGTPFMALGLQQLLVGHIEYALSISAAVLAVVQGGLWAAARRLGERGRELAVAYAGLGMAFVAVAVPLALDGGYISTVWAAQGGLLVWVGCRRGRLLTVVGGGLLQALAGAGLAVRLAESLPYAPDVRAVANEYFLAAAALALAGLVSGWRMRLAADRLRIDAAVEWLVVVWWAGWWLTGGLVEIGSQIDTEWLSASLVFAVASFGAAVAATRRLRWPHLDTLGLLIPPALVAGTGVSLATQDHPLDLYGWAAWPVSLAVFYVCLRRRERHLGAMTAWLRARLHGDAALDSPVTTTDVLRARLRGDAGDAHAFDSAHGSAPPPSWPHVLGFWLLAVIACVESGWQVRQAADGVWPLIAPLAAGLALAGAVLWGDRWLSWPLGAARRAYLAFCAGPMLVLLAVVVFEAGVLSDGNPEPLEFVPVLNPLALLAAAVLATGFAWRRPAAAEARHPLKRLAEARWAPVLAVTGTVLVTAETARTVHHWRGVDWELEALATSTTLQSALSVIWAVIALSGMVLGVRLARRVVWVAGASWMAVVVAKLFLVDLANLGAVSRVVSFLGVGVLLLIVGYLAPVPPAAPDQPAGRVRR